MFVVIVKFSISKDLDENSIKNKFEETAPIYLKANGLLRKNYLFNKDKNIAGGVYIFDNSKNAYAWFDESRIKWLAERYSQPEISFFDSLVEVDNISKQIHIK